MREFLPRGESSIRTALPQHCAPGTSYDAGTGENKIHAAAPGASQPGQLQPADSGVFGVAIVVLRCPTIGGLPYFLSPPPCCTARRQSRSMLQQVTALLTRICKRPTLPYPAYEVLCRIGEGQLVRFGTFRPLEKASGIDRLIVAHHFRFGSDSGPTPACWHFRYVPILLKNSEF